MPPPTPVALNDVVQVVIQMRYQSQIYLNVLHYQSLQNWAPALYEETLQQLSNTIENDVVTGIIPAYLPVVPPSVTFETITVQRVYPTRDYYVRSPVGSPGEADGTTLAGSLGATITKLSQVSGRGRQGSFHVPALPTDAIVNGLVATGFLPVLNTLAQSLRLVQMEDGAGTGFQPGMFNPTLGGPNNFVPLIDTIVQNTARVMRRRTVGVGI